MLMVVGVEVVEFLVDANQVAVPSLWYESCRPRFVGGKKEGGERTRFN